MSDPTPTPALSLEELAKEAHAQLGLMFKSGRDYEAAAPLSPGALKHAEQLEDCAHTAIDALLLAAQEAVREARREERRRYTKVVRQRSDHHRRVLTGVTVDSESVREKKAECIRRANELDALADSIERG